MKQNHKISKTTLPVYDRIRQILDSARTNIARSVNTTQVVANWLIGREIVEEEQLGKTRAAYGEGYSARNLRFMRQFYLEYVGFLPGSMIWNAPRTKSGPQHKLSVLNQRISHAKCGLLGQGKKGHAVRSLSAKEISETLPRKSWQPGALNPNLSWTHYRTLLRVEKPEVCCM